MKKRVFALLIAMALLTVSVCALAEPPAKSEGTPPAGQGGNPPDMPTGNPPDGMGTPPDGMGNPSDGMGGPGGQSSAPSEYAAVNTLAEDATLTGAIESTGTDENAVHVAAGETTIEDAQISRVSNDSTGGDSASFYGVGAAVLTTGGSATVRNSAISTDAKGGAGVFAGYSHHGHRVWSGQRHRPGHDLRAGLRRADGVRQEGQERQHRGRSVPE